MSTAATAITDRFEIANLRSLRDWIIGTGKYRSYAEIECGPSSFRGSDGTWLFVGPLDRSVNHVSRSPWPHAADTAEHCRRYSAADALRNRSAGARGAADRT